MLICRFRTGDREVHGIVEGDTIVEVQGGLFDGLQESDNKYALRLSKTAASGHTTNLLRSRDQFPRARYLGCPYARRRTPTCPKKPTWVTAQ